MTCDFILSMIMVMVAGRSFELVFAPQVVHHLRAIDRKHHSRIRKEIEDQLLFQPHVETKNRKPLIRPIAVGGEWELRLGPQNRFRVFYELDVEGRRVRILAIGEKRRNRLVIGGEEIQL